MWVSEHEFCSSTVPIKVSLIVYVFSGSLCLRENQLLEGFKPHNPKKCRKKVARMLGASGAEN